MSDELDAQEQWAAAFVAVQADLPEIKKTKTAKITTPKASFSYSYADLSDIIDKVRPVLIQHGLAAVQDVAGDGNISVQTRIYHKAGHCEIFGPLVLAVNGDARAAGTAITYARRYALAAALGIAPDEDKDGEMPAPEPQVSVSTLSDKYGIEKVVAAFAKVRAKHGKNELVATEGRTLEMLRKAPAAVQEEVAKELAAGDWE